MGFKAKGQDIVVIGRNHLGLGQSLWLREIKGREEGLPPAVNLEDERRMGEIVRALIAGGEVTAVHDISDGGLLVAVAEMALKGGIGARIDGISGALAFSEAQARYVVTLPDADVLEGRDIPFTRLGRTGGDAVVVNGQSVSLATLREANESFFRDWMEG